MICDLNRKNIILINVVYETRQSDDDCFLPKIEFLTDAYIVSESFAIRTYNKGIR